MSQAEYGSTLDGLVTWSNPIFLSRYETTAARIEAETSTAKLASEVHHQAEIAHKAAVDAASNAQVCLSEVSLPSDMANLCGVIHSTSPHRLAQCMSLLFLLCGCCVLMLYRYSPAGATTTAANLESQAPTNSAATNIHSTAHEIQNAAGDAASTASVCLSHYIASTLV